MNLKAEIAAFAREHNLIYGCGSAEPFEEYRESLQKQVPFVRYTFEERLNPSLTLKGAKSLIALGLSYNYCYEKQGDGLTGLLSEGAVGEDYHLVMGKLLKGLGERLFKNGEEYCCFCDTGPLADGLVALRCGLGFWGLNHGVISDRFGSMFFIGYIITTAFIEPDEKPENKCNGCGKCITSCPSGALHSDGSFDVEKCAANLTQQKGVIADEYKKYIGNYIYGCDVCRRVCPLTPKPTRAEGCGYPEIEAILSLSNREFKAHYGNTAIGWRGKGVIARNALIALGNLKDKRGLRLLEPYLDSSSEALKDAALWAKKQIEGE